MRAVFFNGGVMELWKPVIGYEGTYEVSNEGGVRSIDRMDIAGRNRISGKLLSPEVTHKGYLRVGLTGEGKTKKHSIHRLVLCAFVGQCPEGHEGCHDDGNPANNALINLRWGTPAANWNDRRAHNTATIGERHPGATIDETKAAVIKMELALGFQARVVAIWNDASIHVVNQIKSGRTWRHI